MRPYFSPFGSPRIKHYETSTCVSTNVIRQGDIVSPDTVVSTGGFRVVRAEHGGGNGANLLNTTNVLGIALADSTYSGDTTGLVADGKGLDRSRYIPVAVNDGHTEFMGYLKGGLPAASSLIGMGRAVIWDSTLAIWQVDSTNSTAALANVRVVGIAADQAGDTNGAVVFKFYSTQCHPSVVNSGW